MKRLFVRTRPKALTLDDPIKAPGPSQYSYSAPVPSSGSDRTSDSGSSPISGPYRHTIHWRSEEHLPTIINSTTTSGSTSVRTPSGLRSANHTTPTRNGGGAGGVPSSGDSGSRDAARMARRAGEGQRGQTVEEQLRHKISYLIASVADDEPLVMDICRTASLNESTAKEAVRCLRSEFKYGDPIGQFTAAKLWAMMLRHSSLVFVQESTSRKFLGTVENLLQSPDTSPLVRERLMEVIAAAAYASGEHERGGFRGLWLRVKPSDKPDKGIPFLEETQFSSLPLDLS